MLVGGHRRGRRLRSPATTCYTLGLALTIGLGALSLVLLSGYGGQVWLCQFTFMGLGAWAMTKVGGGDSVLGVLAAIGLCAAAGGILALPALRLRGLYMALATLAFAVLMDQLFFTNPSVIPNGSMTVGRPDIFGMHFTTDRAFMVLIAIVFALCLIGVGALRRGPFGRRLVAMSDSQAACATVGMNITRTKLAVFVIAGGMAGLAGALYGGMSRTVSFSQFSFVNSLVLFVAVALAGITVLSGAVQAGIGVAFCRSSRRTSPRSSGFTYILFGVGIIAVGTQPLRPGAGLLPPRRVVGRARATPAGRRRCRAARRPRSRRAVAAQRCAPLAEPATAARRPALAVEDVSVRFGGLQALDAVDLEVAAGEVHGLIGPNGAGKTTLFNVITGLQRPTHGTVHLATHDMTGSSRTRAPGSASAGPSNAWSCSAPCPPGERADGGRGAAGQAHRAGGPRREEADYQLARVGILHVADEPTDSLPPGSARLVEMARALATSRRSCCSTSRARVSTPRRPTALGEVLQQLASEGMGVLLVEHDMALVMAICARVDVLDNGSVIARGDPATVRADPVVQEAYLGGGTSDPASHARRRPVGGTAAPYRADGRPEAADRIDAVALSRPSTCGPGYGRIEVLHGVSLEVRPGSALALLGPNGAGKSTLLKAISGQLALTAGTVEVAGRRLGRNATEQLARSGVCMIPEGRSIFPNLTVRENLLMYTFRRSGMKSAWVEERAFERFPVLADRRKQLAGTLSGGEQRMLSMARALTTDPEILLLDELSMGLAPLIVDELYGVVGQLVASEGLTIIMVEQFVQTALSVADQAAIMVNGELVKQGKPEDIRRRGGGRLPGRGRPSHRLVLGEVDSRRRARRPPRPRIRPRRRRRRCRSGPPRARASTSGGAGDGEEWRPGPAWSACWLGLRPADRAQHLGGHLEDGGVGAGVRTELGGRRATAPVHRSLLPPRPDLLGDEGQEGGEEPQQGRQRQGQGRPGRVGARSAARRRRRGS